MANIIITKLTASLANTEGFQKLNTLVFNVSKREAASLGSRTTSIRTNAVTQVTIKGGEDAYFVDANDESIGTTINLAADQDHDLPIRWSNADAQITIENKDAIVFFGSAAQSTILTIDVDQLNYAKSLAYLVLANYASNYIGLKNIDLRNNSKLSTIIINYVSGEIDFDYFPTRSYSLYFYNLSNLNNITVEKLAKLKTASSLSLTSSNIKFSLEDVLVGMLNNGRTANLTVKGESTVFRFNSEALPYNLDVEFGVDTITVKKSSDSSTVATYSDGEWIYN